MNKVYALISAAAVAAVMAAPVAAQQLPLNNTVSGGQGDVQLDGQGFVIGGALGAGTIAAIVVIGALLVITVANNDGTTTTTTAAAS